MIQQFVFSVLLFFGLCLSTVADELKDNEWIVDYITETSIHTSVNGEVTHGDRLHVRFVQGQCDVGNLITFVYTYADHPNILQLEDQSVRSIFMGEEVTVAVLYTSSFLMGHRATVDVGWMEKESLKQLLGRSNPITMKYLDSDDVKISDYFDILQNSWSNVNLNAALDKASKMCEGL